MAHEVFISYSHKDKPIADGICANLEVAGVRCWIAPRDMMPGEDWPSAIGRAIPQSRIMVMIFSSSSNNSDQVYRELFMAADNKAIIIPFKIEDVVPEARFGYLLAGTHWLDAINPPLQEQINNLVECVKSFMANPEGKMPVFQPSTVRPASFPPLAQTQGQKQKFVGRIPAWEWAILIVAMILAVGASFIYLRGQATQAIPSVSPAPSQTIQSEILATREMVTPTGPMQTDTPESINTQVVGPQSDQARAFAEPILKAIAQRKPDFEDDFSAINSDWWFSPSDGGKIEKGVARLQINNGWESMANEKALTGKDFVLQFDARLVSGDTTSQITIGLHVISASHSFFLNLYPAIQSWDVGNKWGSDKGNNDGSGDNGVIGPLGKTMHITIITRGSWFALYINQIPVTFINNSHLDNAGKNNFNCVSFSPAECEFDNVKFWNLTGMAGLP
jgi:hypothetical protein